MTKLGYLIPASIVLTAITALLGWDLLQNIRATSPRQEKRR